MWSSERWWPSPHLHLKSQRHITSEEGFPLIELECCDRLADGRSEHLYLPDEESDRSIFTSLSFLGRCFRHLALEVPKEKPSLLKTGSSNPIVQWGDFILKFRIAPHRMGAERERKILRLLSGKEISPALLGEAAFVDGEPVLLVMERVEGESAWDEAIGMVGRGEESNIIRLALEAASLIGKLHFELNGRCVDEEREGMIHGDFHLGQLINSPTGSLKMLDFEGAPGALLRDRAPFLDDLAGLWRSVDYLYTFHQKAAVHLLTPDFALNMLSLWSQSLGSEGARYWGGISKIERLSSFFSAVARRNLWELHYEEGRRPEWLWIAQEGWKRSVALLNELYQ